MAWRSNTPAEWSDLCAQKVRSDMRFFLQKMASGSEGLVDGLESYFIVKIILWSHLEIRSGCMDDCIDSGEIRLQKWFWGMYKKKGSIPAESVSGSDLFAEMVSRSDLPAEWILGSNCYLQRWDWDQICMQRWCWGQIDLQIGYQDRLFLQSCIQDQTDLQTWCQDQRDL